MADETAGVDLDALEMPALKPGDRVRTVGSNEATFAGRVVDTVVAATGPRLKLRVTHVAGIYPWMVGLHCWLPPESLEHID
ncbi:hypothetical protein SEA_GUDMIT_67 [Gordonia phage Gudmit]|nr:hypothetical protein SEA_GUDMIT_67 [Gordonia phage Gudmit]